MSVGASLFAAACFGTTTIAADPSVTIVVPAESGLDSLRFVLVGRIAKTLKIERCRHISGLTCTIRLQLNQVLPTRIYSTELGSDGQPLGPEKRVLYPNLSPGERGRATVSLEDHPDRILVRGVWDGPYQSPY